MIILLVSITILVKTDAIEGFDNYVYNLITSNSNENLTIFFKIVTNFAYWGVIVALCVLSLILIKNKWIGISICINSINSTIINKILKMIFIRPRPDVLKLIKQGGYSFPSGHAMASMSFYGFLIYLIYKSNFSKNMKILFITILSIIILLVGISRIYLGVHYASDIIAGYLVSMIYMGVYIKILDSLKNK